MSAAKHPVATLRARASAAAGGTGVSNCSFSSRIAASLRVPVEEARVIARLQLDRMNAPSRAAATARQGVTRYPNTKPFVLGDEARLLRAAPSRDRRVRLHAPSSHGAQT